VKKLNFIKRRKIRIVLGVFFGLGILINIVAYNHAYQFTHYSNSLQPKTQISPQTSLLEVLSILFFSIENPRPKNHKFPRKSFKTYSLEAPVKIECWEITVPNARETILLFHGYGGEKSGMLPLADAFLEMGRNVVLVDFRGSGNSEGNEVTIGYKEAQEVKAVFEFIQNKLNHESNHRLILFGTSMGATAIMRAVAKLQIQPDALILECPFASLVNTVKNRFRMRKLPPILLSELLVFWGSVQGNFWGFDHEPIRYASQIKCPVLLMHGAKDEKVTLESIQKIYSQLGDKKFLKIFPNLQHQSYLLASPNVWKQVVQEFFDNIKTQ